MRLDKYLKVSRIIKRRTVAKEVCEGERVSINGKVAKPSTTIKEGDIIEIKFANRSLKARIINIAEHISFDDEKILLNTKLGFLTIKGSELKMNKLDVQNGDVIIVGNTASIVYSSKEVKKEKESIISKLFK